jgi:hypothetical protein
MATEDEESAKERNQRLDLQILKREPPDEITQAAPWYQRLLRIATLYSTVKAWLQ